VEYLIVEAGAELPVILKAKHYEYCVIVVHPDAQSGSGFDGNRAVQRVLTVLRFTTHSSPLYTPVLSGIRLVLTPPHRANAAQRNWLFTIIPTTPVATSHRPGRSGAYHL
jgi:hypothetical protein